MALTTKEIQTQKALMEQQIENMEKELEKHRDEYHEAFGSPEVKEKTSKFKVILFAIIVGIGGGIALIYAINKYFPGISFIGQQ